MEGRNCEFDVLRHNERRRTLTDIDDDGVKGEYNEGEKGSYAHCKSKISARGLAITQRLHGQGPMEMHQLKTAAFASDRGLDTK